MAKLSRPRYGSLQVWPRKRSDRSFPRVNWSVVKGEGILGFVAYKAGMATAIVRDKTDKSMTANKKIALPVTVLEVPKFRIYSVRFYAQGKVMKEVVVSTDASLKGVVRMPKTAAGADALDKITGWNEIRAIIYPVMKDMFKKTPDVAEVTIGGKGALELAKSLVGKDISLKDVLKEGLVDVRGLTTGKGLVGPVKRFGISLKSHKSEKGVRRPGSLGPWHPARVTFRAPMAGQLGVFNRVHYNLKVLTQNNAAQIGITPKSGFPHYGTVRGDYVLVQGSVQGPPKRQILITPAMRPTKRMMKKNFEFLEVKQ